MDEHSGDGDDSGELACICTACAPSIAIIKAIGVACAHTGTCGVVTITIRLDVGSGAGIEGLAITCTACGFCADGMALAG